MCKKIRALDSEDWIPIIFLSASVDDVSIANGIDAGGDDYLTKPCSEITLAAKIRAMQRIADMRKKLFETTQKLYLLSSTDTLTGIYNRLQFNRSIKEIGAAADRYHHMIGLLFIDVDNFKNINDNFGHHIGDLFLIEVAKRLKSCVRANDFIARLGGDEFAIILGEIASKADAEQVAKNVIRALSVDFYLEDHLIRNGASIGIACYPDVATTQDNLMLNADVAMYHAKEIGRNNYQFFTEKLNDRYKQHINLENSLKFALERKELYLQYQPIVDLATRKLVGLETLLRWNNTIYGDIAPGLFIPIAEETGLMSHLGTWVLETACKQITLWNLEKQQDFKL